MDEMRIESKFLKGIICKFIERQIKKKFGYEIYLDLRELHIAIVEGDAHVKLSAEAKVNKEVLTQISQIL